MSDMPWQIKRMEELNEELADLLKTKRMILILMFVSLVIQIVGFFREGFDLTLIGLFAFLLAMIANIWADGKFQKCRKEFDEVWESLPDSVKNRHRPSVKLPKDDDEIM